MKPKKIHEGSSILIVDDKQENIMALKAVLAPLRLNIIPALSGEEALRQLLHHEVAVILMDVSMPIMDGFETAALIRERKSLKNIPIVFITGIAFGQEEYLKGYSLGAVDYIYKPIIPGVLTAKVQVFINLFRMKKAVEFQSKKISLANERLKEEIVKRKQAEIELSNANKSLEIKVAERIIELKAKNEELKVEVLERKRAEDEVIQLNRILKILTFCNESVIHITKESVLLNNVCHTIVGTGGYPLVWIGFGEHDQKASVHPAAHLGFKEGYLEGLNLTWSDVEYGQHPVCKAIRTGKPCISLNILSDTSLSPWHNEAKTLGYNSVIGLPLKTGKHILGAIGIYASVTDAFKHDELTLLNQLAGDLAYGITALRIRKELDQGRKEIQKSYEKLERILEETVESLSSTVEKRDPYTSGHEHRVTELACAIAHELSMPTDVMQCIQIAGLLHDIGKIAVPIEILTKPGKLTSPEFQIIQTHSRVGYDILKPIEFPWPVQQVVLQHHEKIDGSGYPNGVSGKNILLAARMLTVADVVEAITSHRPYRPALGLDAAMEEITKNKGILYDADVVDACITLLTKKGFKF